MANRIRTAVVPAAGQGTRFLPLSKAVPKELAPVIDRPAIHYVVHEAMAAGIEHIVIVTASGKEALQDYFTPSSTIVRTIRDKGNPATADELEEFAARLAFSYPVQEEQLGLGHAVLCAKDAVQGEPFVVILPDDLLIGDESVLGQMISAWGKDPGNYLAVEEVLPKRISSYGIVDPVSEPRTGQRLYRLKGVVEKPSADRAPSNLGIVGRYILMPEVFDALERTAPGAIGEIQLTDGIASTLETTPLFAYRYSATRYDVGTPLGLLHASISLALQRQDTASLVEQWLRR